LALNPKKFFESEIAKVKQDLETWSERRRRFTRENHVVGASPIRPQQLTSWGDSRASATNLQADIAQTRSTVDMMKRMQDQPEVDLPNLAAPSAGDAMSETRRRVVEQEARVALLRERYREDTPEVANALETLKTMRDMLQNQVNARVAVSESASTRWRPGSRS